MESKRSAPGQRAQSPWSSSNSRGAWRCPALGKGSRKRRLGRALPTDVALIGPHISPVAVSSAVVDPDVVQISVDGFQGRSAIEVEDDVRVTHHLRMAGQDLVAFPKRAAPVQVRYHLIDQILRGQGQRTILVGKIDLRLDAAAARRSIRLGQQVREAQAGKANVRIVKIGDLTV